MKEEIYAAEQANADTIVLHKERLFWIAYERSAYLFHTHVRPYRAQRKFIKKLGLEMVSLGFPDSVLAVVTAPVLERTAERMVFQSPAAVDEGEFVRWKDRAVLYVKQPKFAPAREPVGDIDEIARRLREFDLESRTPLECMALVAELKRTEAGLRTQM